MIPQTALVSVYNKVGLEMLCTALNRANVRIISTGGTAATISAANIPVTPIESITGFSDLMDGRVKTLHTSIYAGLLARRETADMDLLKAENILPIDMVVCNFYPLERGIEHMDIGGPCMVRAAAKNWQNVIVVTHPNQYEEIQAKLSAGIDAETRKRYAASALRYTAYYDAVLASESDSTKFPSLLTLPFRKSSILRYGENPHQDGAFYIDDLTEPCISSAEKLQGKDISYNNFLDANGAIECIKEFSEPTIVIMKHATPSGIATDSDLIPAWNHALATDEYSPYGGVVAVNRKVSVELAEKMTKIFLEVIIAPDFSPQARSILGEKKNLRLLQLPGIESEKRQPSLEFRSVSGGLLLQDRDNKPIDTGKWRVVTDCIPSKSDLQSMEFAVKCVKHIKSNAVVFVKDTHTVAIGGGQTSRVDASWIAVHKGSDNIPGSIMGSDAFFPFRDAVDVAAKAGIRAIIQPGGSIRDEEVIRAANEHNISMVFSGRRYFLH